MQVQKCHCRIETAAAGSQSGVFGCLPYRATQRILNQRCFFFCLCSLATVSDEATHILMCFIAVCPSAGESFTRAICAPSAAQEPIKNAWAASAPAEKQVRRTLHFGQSLFFFFRKVPRVFKTSPKLQCAFTVVGRKNSRLLLFFLIFFATCRVCVCVCHRGSPVQRDSTDSSETNGGGTKKKKKPAEWIEGLCKEKKKKTPASLACPRCPVCARARVHKTTGK